MFENVVTDTVLSTQVQADAIYTLKMHGHGSLKHQVPLFDITNRCRYYKEIKMIVYGLFTDLMFSRRSSKAQANLNSNFVGLNSEAQKWESVARL